MGDFLNILTGDYEEIDEKYYYQIREPKEHKFSKIKNVLESIGINNVIECNSIQNNNENYYYFIYQLSDLRFLELSAFLTSEFIELLKNNKNLNVVFLNEHESETEENYILLTQSILKQQLNPNQFYFINNNSNLGYYKIKNNGVNVHSLRFLPSYYSKHIFKTDIDIIKDKEFLFLCHNKRIKPHRYGILLEMKKLNILNNTDWSFLLNDDLNRDYYQFFKKLYSENEITSLLPHIEYFNKLGIKKSKYEYVQLNNNLENDFIYTKTFESAYVNIVTETYFEGNRIHITEKSFKPFNFYQLPIFLTTCGHVKKLKEIYGFDMFEDLIDHTYDNESDDKKRFSLVVREIEKLNASNIKDFYNKNIDRLIQNKKIIYDISNDNYDIEYFKKLKGNG
jgi:hypothetical protein